MRLRDGYSMMELLVALTVGAIVLAAVGALSARQQRFHRDVVAATERMERVDQAAALLPVALRAIAPGEGDIPAGGARDTSLEFRATIATAVVCDTTRGSVVLAPVRAELPHLASVLERPETGDTLWMLMTTETGESWTPRPIASVIDSTTRCLLGGLSPWTGGAHTSLVVRLSAPMLAASGTPVRITRLWKYSLYRASDGEWYLGAREWNSTTLRFNTIQPVSGPFLSPVLRGLSFRYTDSLGVVVPSGSVDTHRIAFIQVGLAVDPALGGSLPHAISIRASATAAITLRNRPR